MASSEFSLGWRTLPGGASASTTRRGALRTTASSGQENRAKARKAKTALGVRDRWSLRGTHAKARTAQEFCKASGRLERHEM